MAGQVSSKAIIKTILSHAGNGEIQPIHQLSHRLAPAHKDAVQKVLAVMAPAGSLHADQKNTLQNKIVIILQSSSVFDRIMDQMPRIFALLTEQEKAKSARTCTLFLEQSFPMLLYSLKQPSFSIGFYDERPVSNLNALKMLACLNLKNKKICSSQQTPIAANATLSKITAQIPQILSCLSVQEIRQVALINKAFNSDAYLALLNLSRTSYTFKELKDCQKALHLNSMAEVIALNPEQAKSVTTLDLSHSSVTKKELDELLTVCPNITELNLASCKSLKQSSISSIIKKLPQLVSINLSNGTFRADYALTDPTIIGLGNHCPRLKRINLDNCDFLTRESMGTLKGLTSLTPPGSITDDDLVSMSTNYRELIDIDLSYCWRLTDASIVALCQNCPQLQNIDLPDEKFRAEFYDGSGVPTLPLTDSSFNPIATLPNLKVKYRPSTPLGRLYRDVFHGGNRRISNLINAITDRQILDLIYFPVMHMSNKVVPPGETWGVYAANHLEKLHRSIHLSLSERLGQFSQEGKNRVYNDIYRLAGSPKTDDPRWGEHHARDDMARLADALSLNFQNSL